MAATHLQALGMSATAATELAVSLGERLGITEQSAIDVLLSQYTTLGVSMSPADWCSCFSRHPDLLSTTPEALAAGVEWLQQVYGVDSQELAAVVLRCPELLHPGQHEIQAKVSFFAQHCSTSEAQGPATAQLVSRLSHAPKLLCEPLSDLEAQVKHMAVVLSVCNKDAARVLYRVPDVAEVLRDVTAAADLGHPDSPASLLEQRVVALQQLLSLDAAQARELVLRQPTLLVSRTKALEHKVEVFEQLFGPGHLAEVAAAAPQLFTMNTDAVRSRHELLQQLVQLQPHSWQLQLAEATTEKLAVWLAASERRLRRLELAAGNKQLSRMPLHRLISLSEGAWLKQAAAAGILLTTASTGNDDAADIDQQQDPARLMHGSEGSVSDIYEEADSAQSQKGQGAGSGPEAQDTSAVSADVEQAIAALIQASELQQEQQATAELQGQGQYQEQNQAENGSVLPGDQQDQGDAGSTGVFKQTVESQDSPAGSGGEVEAGQQTAAKSEDARDVSSSTDALDAATVAAAVGSEAEAAQPETRVATPSAAEAVEPPTSATAAADVEEAQHSQGSSIESTPDSPSTPLAGLVTADIEPAVQPALTDGLETQPASPAKPSAAASQAAAPSPARSKSPAKGRSSTTASPAVSSSSPTTAVAPPSSSGDSASNIEMERREAFMSKLLAKVPSYAVTLLGTDQADKLHFLSHMAPADLSAVLAQPRAEELLEAVYAVHLKKQQQQKEPTGDESEVISKPSSKVLKSRSSDSAGSKVDKAPAAAVSPAKPAAAAKASKVTSSSSQVQLSQSAAGATVAAAGTSTAAKVITDKGRQYLFLDGTVCSVCGSKGHLGGDCRTTRCSTCRKIGHPYGRCSEACGVCGKRHKPGPCTQPQCYYCKLYGHDLEQCPTAHCKKCDYYGHVPSLCPLQKQQQQVAGTSSSSASSRPAAAVIAAAAGTSAVRPSATTSTLQPSSAGRPAPSAAASAAAGARSSAISTPRAAPAALPLSTSTTGGQSAPPGMGVAVRGSLSVQQQGRQVPTPVIMRPAPAAAAVAAVHAQHDARPAHSPKAVVAPAAPAAQNRAIQDGDRRYLFRKGVICSVCGKPGHLGSLCDTPWCGRCQMFGHRYGECHQACHTCGRRHAFTLGRGEAVCYTPYCELCDMFSHKAEDCPTAHCSSCGFWGHQRSSCPVQQQQEASVAVQPTSSRFTISTQQHSNSQQASTQQHSNSQQAATATPSGSYSSTSISSACGRYEAAYGGAWPGDRSLRSDRLEQPATSSSSARAVTGAGPSAASAAAAATSATASSKWLTLTDSGRQYRCHQYPACNRCGTVGHLPSACKTPYCSTCGKYGHLAGSCYTACQTCGKQHEPGPEGCYMPLCPYCKLYGHIGKHCPSAKCRSCGYYGHAQRICPEQHLFKEPRTVAAAAVGDGSSNRPVVMTGSSKPEYGSTYQGPGTDTFRSRGEFTGRSGQPLASSSEAGHDSWAEGLTDSSSSRPGKSSTWQGDAEFTGATSRSSRALAAVAAAKSGKLYYFIGQPVCYRCGRTGHEGAECHTDYCNSCGKWGHATGACMGYCRKCGKNHTRGGCTMALCNNCQLWGHSAKHCPRVQCTECGYWGHDGRICPDVQQQGSSKAAGAASGGMPGQRPTSSSRSYKAIGPAGSAPRGSTMLGTDSDGWGSNWPDAGEVDNNSDGWGSRSASAAATRAIRGSDSGACTAPVNAHESSWSSSAAGGAGGNNNNNSSTWTAAQSNQAYAAGGRAGAASATAAGSGDAVSGNRSIRQFHLEAPAATEEEAKVRGARLVHVLFSSLPDYASALMSDKEKLACLARLSTADVDHILAQAHPEQLLEAVFIAQQLKQKQQMKLQQKEEQPFRQQQRSGPSWAAADQQQQSRVGPAGSTKMATGNNRLKAGRPPGPTAELEGTRDSSSLLMQQMTATLAGFKKDMAGQQRSQGPPEVAYVGLSDSLVEFSEEEDMSDMLGLLGVGEA